MKEKLRLAVFGHKRWSREGGVEIVVKELCTRMAQQGCQVTCYNRAGHHVSGAEYDDTHLFHGLSFTEAAKHLGMTRQNLTGIYNAAIYKIQKKHFRALCSC